MKKVIASLIICCLLFGSLTLSSCSPKNNPANRVIPDSDATSASVAKKKADVRVKDPNDTAEQKKDNENIEKVNGVNESDPKDGCILLDTPKGATRGIVIKRGIVIHDCAVAGACILTFVVYLAFIARGSYKSIVSDYIPNFFGVTSSVVGAGIDIAIGAGIGAVIGYGACALGSIDSHHRRYSEQRHI